MTKEINEQQMQLVRASLLNSIFQLYTQLQQVVSKLPFHPHSKCFVKGMNYFDDGMLWIKEGILNEQMTLGSPEPKKTDAPEELPLQTDVAETKENEAVDVDAA